MFSLLPLALLLAVTISQEFGRTAEAGAVAQDDAGLAQFRVEEAAQIRRGGREIAIAARAEAVEGGQASAGAAGMRNLQRMLDLNMAKLALS